MKSGDIPVQMFREILLFPLRLERIDARDRLSAHIAGLDERRWSKVANLDTVRQSRIWPQPATGNGSVSNPAPARLQEDPAAFKRRNAYAEAAYFHPFVQRFLYSEESLAGLSHLITRERRGLDALVVEANYDTAMPTDHDGRSFDRYQIRLEVERVHCHYVRDPGLLVFSMEIAAGASSPVIRYGHNGTEEIGTPSLAEIQSIMDCLRRSFPPYFRPGDKGLDWNRTIFPSAVTLVGADYCEGLRLSMGEGDIAGMIERMLEPKQMHPLAPWWSEIFRDFNVDGRDEAGPPLCQIGDERMPTLCFVAVEDARAVSRQDQVRLCFADPSGNGYPYDEGFLAGFETENCYDRFWSEGSRYLFSAYSVTLLTSTGNSQPHLQAFNFALDVLQEHVRRHYFRFALMVQINKCGLLAFSSWLSAAMRDHGTLRSTRYRDEVADLRRGFLEFSQITWFSNVSNQQQARELYGRMMEQSGNQALYEEVSRELEQARGELAEIDAAKQAEAAAALNVIALVASAVGLFLTYAQLGNSAFGAGNYLEQSLHLFLGAVMVLAGIAAFVITWLFYEGASLPGSWRKASKIFLGREIFRPGYLLALLTSAVGIVVLVYGLGLITS